MALSDCPFSTKIMTRLPELPDKIDYILSLTHTGRRVSPRYLKKFDCAPNCPICKEPYSRTHKPVRSHPLHVGGVNNCVFGLSCLSSWLDINNDCPLCRRELYSGSINDAPAEHHGDAMDVADDAMDVSGDAMDVDDDENNDVIPPHARDELFPRLHARIQNAREYCGVLWWADDQGELSVDGRRITAMMEDRVDRYRSTTVSIDRNDYTDYQRAFPGVFWGLSTRKFTVDHNKLITWLTARYWGYLAGQQWKPLRTICDDAHPESDNGWQYDLDEDDEPVVRGPVAAHPLAYIGFQSILKTIRNCPHDREISAVELEHRIFLGLKAETNYDGKGLFDSMRFYSYHESGNLPKGFYAWMLDMTEQVLMWHVGSQEASYPRKGVARRVGRRNGRVQGLVARQDYW